MITKDVRHAKTFTECLGSINKIEPEEDETSQHGKRLSDKLGK